MCACTGDVGKAEIVTKPLREFGPPLLALPHPMPYPFSSRFSMVCCRPGCITTGKRTSMRELTDEAIAEHVKFGPRIPTVNSAVHIYAMDGAVQDVGANETAFAYRDVSLSTLSLPSLPIRLLTLYRDWTQQYWRRCTLIRREALTSIS